MAIYESDTVASFSFDNDSGSIVTIFHKHADIPGDDVKFTLPELEDHLDYLQGEGIWGDVTAQALPKLRELNGFPSGADSRKHKPS